MAPVRTKRARVRLIAKRWPVCMRSSRLTQGFFIMEKPTPVAVTIRKALSIPSLATVQQRVASELSIFRLRIVQCVVQTAEDRQFRRDTLLKDRKSTRLNSSHQIISYA